MKKLLHYLAILFLVSLPAVAQVQIGTESNVDQKSPFYPAFDYSYSQSIYLSSEINVPAGSTITSISWYYAGTGTLPYSKDLVVYMGNTTKSAFGSLSDFVAKGSMTQVFSGSLVTNATPGWKTITLSQGFVYNGTNLVIAVDENTAENDGFSDRFYNSAVSTKRTLTNWGDTVNVDPANPGSMCCGITSGWVSYVPNVILGGIQQLCPNAMGIKASNITNNSATISWQAPTTPPQGGTDYYYNFFGTPPGVNTQPSGHIDSGNSFDLSSLFSGSPYYVWVRNVCEDGVKSAWSNVLTFNTDCDPVSSFMEGFDNVETPALPSCWRSVVKGTPVNSVAGSYSFSAGSNAESLPNAVEINQANNPGTVEVILVGPRLSNLNAGTHHLVFYAKGNRAIVEVGTMDKNDKDGVFTPFGYSALVTTAGYVKHDVDFKPYRGSDKYIAIRLNVSQWNPVGEAPLPNFAHVDSFNWEYNSSCPDAAGIKALSTTPSTVNIGWDTTAANGYQVALGSTSVTDPNELTPTTPTSGLSQEISGLAGGTTYKYWVRSVCGNENGNWQGPYFVTTTCAAITKFQENFETVTEPNLPACWGKIIRGANVTAFSMVETATSNGNTLVMLHTNTANQADDVILVSPQLNTLQAGSYRMKFYARKTAANNNVSLQVGTLSSNTEAAVFTEIQPITLSDEMVQYTVEFSEYAGQDTFIGFRLKDFNQSSYVTIDDINYEFSPQCADVTGLSLTGLSPNSATVSWTAGGGETSWYVALGNAGDTDPDQLTSEKVDMDPTKTFNLDPATTYRVWVRSYCSSTELGAWTEPIEFTTGCAPASTIDEDFENAMGSNLPNCWSKLIRGYTGDSSNPPYVKTSDAYSPWNSKVATLYKSDANVSTDIILISPYVSNLAGGTYRIRFIGMGDAKVQLGTLNSTLGSAVFTPIQSVEVTHTPKEYVVDFSSAYGTTNDYIGFRVDADQLYTYVQVDNIIWEPIPPCPDIRGLKVKSTTTDTATFGWDADGNSKWQLAFGPSSMTDPDSVVPETITGTPLKFADNLASGTTYKAWVRTVCDDRSTLGNWFGPLLITTQCVSTGIPYSQNFETATLPNMPVCTTAVNMADALANWYTGNNPGYGFTSNTLIYSSDLYTDANAWYFTRGIQLTGGQNYNLSFRYGGAMDDIFYYENSLKVMYGLEPNQGNMTETVVDLPSFAVEQPVDQSAIFTPETSGVYYFGFNVYSPNNSYFMFIDDIVIDVSLASANFDAARINYYPNPVKNVLNMNYAEEIQRVEVYNLLAQRVLSKDFNERQIALDMSSLQTGTYMVKMVTANGVQTIKVVKD